LPVVIDGIVDQWPAFSKWKESFLREHFGHATVAFKLSPSNVHPVIGDDGELPSMKTQTSSLSAYLDQLSRTPTVFLDANVVCLASRRSPVNTELLRLLDDIVTPPFLSPARIDTIGLWLSGRGVRSRLHYDRNGRDNFNAQVAGQKDFVMVSPTQITNLYPFPILSSTYNFSRVDAAAPDLETYPRFSEVESYRGTLHAGDMLFIPAYWYHHFEHLHSFNLNVNFWADAGETKMTAAALRQEVIAGLTHAARAAGLDHDARWKEFVHHVERYCLTWSPDRPTPDELKEGAVPGQAKPDAARKLNDP
jgi:hypothetical protein